MTDGSLTIREYTRLRSQFARNVQENPANQISENHSLDQSHESLR